MNPRDPSLTAALRKVAEHRREVREARPKREAREPKITGTPGEATPRKFTPRQKLDAFVLQGGKCPDCKKRFAMIDMEMDHEIPLALGGEEAAANHVMRCAPCHRVKTTADIGRIAKAKRQAAMMAPREPGKRPIRSRGFG